MGRTVKPLTIVALPPCDKWEELDKLRKQGHTVYTIGGQTTFAGLTVEELLSADIILGATAWRMDHQHKPYLTLAIKEARMLRYQNHEDRSDSKKRASAAADLGASDTEPSTD